MREAVTLTRIDPAAGSCAGVDAGTQTAWQVLLDSRPVGTVTLRRAGPIGELSWSGTDVEVMRYGLSLAVERSLGELALGRVQARVGAGDVVALRTAARAGLRREGVTRGTGPGGSDEVLLACLPGDPAPSSRDGFIAMLNAGLPTKRVIAQGLLRDPAGRVLLCELTYKREWDLPGGVVERDESPQQGVVREVGEELGLRVVTQRLLAVNWLPAWRGWDDACAFVFDCGVHDAGLPGRLTLQPTEIAAVHWCDPAAVARYAAAATGGLLARLAEPTEGAAYLEAGADALDG